MSISPELLQAVKDKLEYFADVKVDYGTGYERSMEMRARVIIELIEDHREKEAVAKGEKEI